MTFKDGLDRSNEETKSSWSSSEEALAACEGLIFNEPLNGGTKCRYHKVNSVQEACAKCFAVHILKFEILQIT